MLRNARVLLLGGGGLVGSAIAKDLCRLPRHLRPKQLILAALTQTDAEHSAEEILRATIHHSHTMNRLESGVVPVWGDMFTRSEFNTPDISRSTLLQDANSRKCLLEDLYGDFNTAYENSHLVSTIRRHRPHIIVDCINTATIFSYRNIFQATTKLRESLDELQEQTSTNYSLTANDTAINHNSVEEYSKMMEALQMDADLTMLSQTGPQLIRHVQMLARVAEEVGVQQYIKIGTTGTGGMGMNIPYTHSEEKPSKLIMSKAESAFGHSGLLMLWSQTPGAPSIKEIKPAAAVGYRTIDVREVQDHFGNSKIRKCQAVDLNTRLLLNLREGDTTNNGNKKCIDEYYPEISPLRMAVLDMGENGVFTRDEFLTITAPDQMEMITPEEVAEQVVEELMGVATGHNVVSAMRGSLLGPGYRAGIQRMKADAKLRNLEHASHNKKYPHRYLQNEPNKENEPDLDNEATAPSIALGKLGPPQLSKLLFESNILLEYFGTYHNLMSANMVQVAQDLATIAQNKLKHGRSDEDESRSDESDNHNRTFSSLLYVAPSVGVPILLEGNILLRGPNISVPNPEGHSTTIASPRGTELDGIADLGWIDLRVRNLLLWKDRARRIVAKQEQRSASPNQYHTQSKLQGVNTNNDDSETGKDIIVPSDAVAWIFSAEMGGHRDFV